MSTYPLKSVLVDIKHLEGIVEDLYDKIERLTQLIEENQRDYNYLADEYASFRAEVAESHPDFFI